MWQKYLIHIMWSNTLPFLEWYLPPSGTWFQNPAGPKRLPLWFMSDQFPLLCASSLYCYRWFFWGLLILVLLQYQKLGPTILLHLPSYSLFFLFFQRGVDGTASTNLRTSEQLSEGDTCIQQGKYLLLSFPYFPGKGLSWAGYWIHIFQGK